MNEYNPDEIEEKWQDIWQDEGLYSASDESSKEKEYILDMFPYPSGSGLHVGHVEGYTATDIYSRFLRMHGQEVLHPIGWDAFGLPAENYAIKTGTHPREKTKESIDTFKSQIKRLGLSYDWSREINTSSPKYFQWTQWLFTKLFENGLAKKKQAPVNWCPSCQTVLANEQVVDGKCERCDSTVEDKELPQWYLKITEYADELVEGLEDVDWPESTKKAQREWIGRSEGAYIDFELDTDQRFVLLHGFKSSPEKNFHQHLKEELEKRGHAVEVPALPNPDDPEVAEQVAYVLDNIDFDENTVLVGHSLGTVVAMKVAEELEQPLSELILIGAFIDPQFKDGDPRSFSQDFDYEFDFESIQANASAIKILEAKEDDAIAEEQIERVHEKLGGEHILVPVDKPHARGKEEPGVVKEVLPHVRTFTTRPDTLFGATYLVLAPECSHISRLKSEITNTNDVETYIEEAKQKTEEERRKSEDKSGVKIEGVSAVNPATGEKIPIFVADYVLGEYGTGAIMAVPAHDERDFVFANKHNLPIKQVVAPVENELDADYISVDGFIHERAANAVITRESDEKILVQILQMGDEETYKLPGGRADEEESYIDALYRELDEETGYRFDDTVSDLGYFAVAYRRSLEKGSNAEEHLRIKHAFEASLADANDGSLQTEDYEEGVRHEWMDPQTAIERIKETNHFQHEADMVQAYLQDAAVTEDGVLIQSGDFNWLYSQQARTEITDWLEGENIGESAKTYRLRDWSIGRQRYWGTPIPVVYDPDGTPHAIPEEHLPWELPDDVDFEPSGEAPLAQSDELKERTEEIFGEGWTPETDTMDTFVDSSWYYLRFADPQNSDVFADEDKLEEWLPVDLYVGGSEHTVMHLLYARFITKVLNDLGYVDFREPFAKLRHQGMILAEDGRKMSKSLGNVVNPTEVVEQFGADSIRLYEMFLGPLADDKPWQTDSIVGVRRFLEKVWRLYGDFDSELSEDVERKLHRTIKQVTEDTESLKFNTAIAAMMECVNVMREEGVTAEAYEKLVRLLAPYAPHITEELWRNYLDYEHSVHSVSWPEYDEAKTTQETISVAVQVDGKVRDEFEIDAEADEKEITETAKQRKNVAKHLGGKEVERTIYVDGQLVNFVTK